VGEKQQNYRISIFPEVLISYEQ